MEKPDFVEVQSLISRLKNVDRELTWIEKPTNSKFLVCSAQVLDKNLETIEGCVFEGLYRKQSVYSPERFAFTIFLIRASVKYRVFQLEVDDWDKITHRDRNTGIEIKGPHFHIGEPKHWPQAKVIQADYECKNYNFALWLIDFCKEATLKLKYSMEHPSSQEQFSLGL